MTVITHLLDPPSPAFTIRSWNNSNPAAFDTEVAAVAAAKARAALEGRLVHVRNNLTGEVADVHPDGYEGKWHSHDC